MKDLSVIHSDLRARKIKAFEMSNVTDQAVSALAKLGLVFDYATVNQQLHQLEAAGAFRTGVGMDSAFTAPITTPSIPTPIQFLQNWLPGFVKIMTTARKIDELIGIQTVGSWEDEEIIQGIVEPAGVATEYGDHTNIPLASWNPNFERRTIVRAEMGINVGLLEEGRAAKMRLNSAETKRQAAAIALELFRNAVGFFGWRSGGNRTFGFLNDPNLPPMITSSVVGGWGSTTATFQQIIGDVRSWMVALRTQTGDNIDLNQVEVTLALPTRKIDYLTITTDFGVSVRDWLTQTYKGLRIVSAPELQGAGATVGTDDVAYLYLDSVDTSIDGSTDDGGTFSQLVPTKFMTLGTEKRAKSYVEDYSAATAGVLCKRPFAVVRISGI